MTFSKKAILLSGILLCISVQLGAQVRQTREEYISRYMPIAIAHMERYGIPASITMAQGILESDCGNSLLSMKSNNHFGIKCKRNWTGDKVYHDDDAKGECPGSAARRRGPHPGARQAREQARHARPRGARRRASSRIARGSPSCL